MTVGMLMRVSEDTDMATDISVLPRARNPETGRRMIEELVFEVASTQTIGYVANRMRRFIARGVRRAFAIYLEDRCVLEWVGDQWIEIAAVIEDPVFATPVPARSLVEAIVVDDDLARALLAKRNSIVIDAIRQGRAEGHAQGHAEGAKVAAAMLLKLLAARGIAVTPAQRDRIGEASLEQLERWIDQLDTCTSADELA